jgi:hypothetical protein
MTHTDGQTRPVAMHMHFAQRSRRKECWRMGRWSRAHCTTPACNLYLPPPPRGIRKFTESWPASSNDVRSRESHLLTGANGCPFTPDQHPCSSRTSFRRQWETFYYYIMGSIVCVTKLALWLAYWPSFLKKCVWSQLSQLILEWRWLVIRCWQIIIIIIITMLF